ncbi:MAG: pilus assembly protein N-terminal domain-containing protein [Stappiaceae bacterium]
MLNPTMNSTIIRPGLLNKFLGITAVAVLMTASQFVSPTSAAALDGGVSVTIDRAKVFNIEEEAGTVIVGNPAIADVTVHDSETLVITGKHPGSTNLVILNSNGKVIIDESIYVEAAKDAVVTVQRAAARYSFSCKGECTPAVRVGDEAEFYKNTAEQSGTYNEQAEGAAQ